MDIQCLTLRVLVRIPNGTQRQKYYYRWWNPKYSIVSFVHHLNGLYFISGGVKMLINSCITKYCQHVNLNIDNVVAFNINKSLTGRDKDVVLISIYVLPTGGKRWSMAYVQQRWQPWDEYCLVLEFHSFSQMNYVKNEQVNCNEETVSKYVWKEENLGLLPDSLRSPFDLVREITRANQKVHSLTMI